VRSAPLGARSSRRADPRLSVAAFPQVVVGEPVRSEVGHLRPEPRPSGSELVDGPQRIDPANVSPSSAPPPPAPTYAPVTYWMKAAAGVVVVLALALLLVVLRHVLVLVLASLVLAIGLQPAVRWLIARNVKRGAAVAIIFALGLLLVGAFLAVVIPIVARQVTELIQSAPQYLERAQAKSSLLGKLDRQFHLIDKVRHAGAQIPGFALTFARGFASFLFDLVTVTILTAYFATALPSMQHSIARLLRREHREELEVILERTTGRIGGYVTGNVVVSLIAGGVTFVALLAIGVPYALALAVWVALTDLIPTVGALLGAAVVCLVAAFVGVPALVATVVFFVIYQQIENYVIAPRVMRRAIEIAPAAVIIAVLVGGTLAGFFGALLALPIAATIQIVLGELYVKDRIEEVRAVDAAMARRRWWRARREAGRETDPTAASEDDADEPERARVG
jgi:predicted PurR-regulated permease PerM